MVVFVRARERRRSGAGRSSAGAPTSRRGTAGRVYADSATEDGRAWVRRHSGGGRPCAGAPTRRRRIAGRGCVGAAAKDGRARVRHDEVWQSADKRAAVTAVRWTDMARLGKGSQYAAKASSLNPRLDRGHLPPVRTTAARSRRKRFRLPDQAVKNLAQISSRRLARRARISPSVRKSSG